MDVQKVLWSCLVLLTGILGQRLPQVDYQVPRCAAKGSTVTIPCSFSTTHRIVRVRWCVNHLICQGLTPSVYDSNSSAPDPRYRYLGDKTGNCTLQIRNVQLGDNTTFRFRMESEGSRRHFTGQQGVNVTVTGDSRMRISSSSDTWRVGDTIVLSCSTDCTIHNLPVIWKKDNLTTLGETGPSLTLESLTEADSGNYSCGLKEMLWTRSDNFSIVVPAPRDHTLAVRLLLFTLHSLLVITIAAIIVKWTCVRRGQ